MHENEKTLLAVLSGKSVSNRPVWLMRQAGRYLPEYRELRAQADSFLKLCLKPEKAAEATLQPVKRFSLDAAILFADILLVPYALGQGLDFKEGEGPILGPIEGLDWREEKIAPVFETIRLVKKEMPKEATLIGFAGAPWTVFCYMIEKKGKNGFPKALQALKEPEAEGFFEKLIEATILYLNKQIEAGAEVVQLFESHAGLVIDEALFKKAIVEPTQRIIQGVRQKNPKTPIIGFPRGASLQRLKMFSEETGVDALGIDQDKKPEETRRSLGKEIVLQGNLDPALLVKGGQVMKEAAKKIMEGFGEKHIFNLGHGVLPETPPEHVAELVNFIHAYGTKK